MRSCSTVNKCTATDFTDSIQPKVNNANSFGRNQDNAII